MTADAADIAELVSAYATEGLLLPRTTEEIEEAIEDYVVVVDSHDRVRGCAALHSYSPSIAEVASVAVERSAHGSGLGGLVVRAVEAVARQRGHREVFAVTRAERFFDSLGYAAADLACYPEKRARYEALRERGVRVEPKACVRKVLA
jgi:amino-acid N-acetyltransferase